MAKTIDELQIEIQAKSSNAASGIDELSTSLGKLRAAVKGGVGLTTTSKQFRALSQAVKELQAPTQKVVELVEALKPLESIGKSNLGSALNQLKKIPEITAGLDDTKLTEFAAKIQQVTAAVRPLAIEMEKVSRGFSRLPANIQRAISANARLTKSNRSTAFGFNMLAAKIVIVYASMRRVANVIGGWIKESNDYVENLNLFNASMGKYAAEAQKYAEHVGDLLGIDPSAWMRNQGVFMTLATGFGVASDQAALMSKNLTQLGYDISAFFNISVGDAMQKLQSGFSGELEPLRRLGYDLSQAKLSAIALSLGIDKSISSMTQAEKSQLRYYAMLTQVTVAQGDMARTLDAPANQLRIFSAQATQAARALGNIFIPALNAVLPYAIALLKVIRTVANEIANLFGYELPEVDYSGLETITEDAEDATDAINELKKSVLGIDEINVLNPTAASAMDAGIGFDINLPEYDFLGDALKSRVNEIADELEKPFREVLKLVGLIGGGILSWKIGAGLYSFITSLSGLGLSFGAVSSLGPVIGSVVALGSGLYMAYQNNEDIRQSVSALALELRTSFLESITTISKTAIPDLITAWNNFKLAITPIKNWLGDVFYSLWMDFIIPAMSFLSNAVLPTLTSTFLNLWNNVLVPFGQYCADVFGPIILVLADVLGMLWKNIVVPLANAVGGVFSASWSAVASIFNDVTVPAISNLIKNMQFLWKNILMPIISFLLSVLKPAVTEVFSSISNVIGGIKNTLVGLIMFIKGIFTKDWSEAWNRIKQIYVGVWNTFSSVIKAPLNAVIAVIETAINWIIDKMNALSWTIPKWVPKIGGETFGFGFKHIHINRFENGGFPDTGELFIAREAGAEMVGTIGGRTAVANNDQITAGIASAVYQAFVSANGGNSGGDWTIQVVDGDGRVKSETIITAAERKNRRDGRTIIPLGV